MKHNKRPVRHTGQHFTIDTQLINHSIHLADLQKEDIVLDIGAGRGFLTVHLVKYSDNVIAIENDPRLILKLKSHFRRNKSVSIVNIDFRKFSCPAKLFKVVSNIPYRITSEILKSLMFTHCEYFIQGCLVMQLEPAQKLIQQTFFNPYKVFYHTFYEIELIYEIDPASFIPPPKVRSALIKINKKHSMNLDSEMKKKYLDFLYFMLKYPDLQLRTTLKKLFHKRQMREIAKKYNLKLEDPVTKMSARQFSECFAEMRKIVPEKFHPKQ